MIKVAVASGKGGTGKTFVSTHLFQTMRDAGVDACMVDCDAEVPNAALFLSGKELQQWPVHVFCPVLDPDKCVHCGKCAEACEFHAITSIPAAHYIKVLYDLCHACTACMHMCEHQAIAAGLKEVGRVTAFGQEENPLLFQAKMNEGEHSPVTVIREAIQHAESGPYACLILDAPPGCACPFVNTVKDADYVILVAEPTPFGLSDLKHTVMVLRQMGKHFGVLLNRADIGDDRLKAYLAADNIRLLAEIPYSEQIATAYSKGSLTFHDLPQLHEVFTNLMNNVLQK